MKILHISAYSDASYGGPVSTLVGLTRAQSQAGDEVTVATLLHHDRTHSVIPQMEASSVRVATLGHGRGPLLRSSGLHALPALVRANDVVHIHGVWDDIVARGLTAAARANVPSILRPCGMLTRWSLDRHALRKKILWRVRAKRTVAMASVIHFASGQERDESVVPIGAQPWFVEPNGIDVASLRGGDAARFRTAFRIDATSRIVLYVGRLHPGKGIEILIPAFAAARKRDEILVLAGPSEDAYRRHLEGIVNSEFRKDADRAVRFTGMIGPGERNDALAAATIFALPSDHESFGNAALEALAAGVPCVLSNRVPLAAHVIASNCGRVCTSSRDEVAHALRDLLDDTATGADYSGRAIMCASAFDWTRVAARVRMQYVTLVSTQ